mgnify:CR=1 FL=1
MSMFLQVEVKKLVLLEQLVQRPAVLGFVSLHIKLHVSLLSQLMFLVQLIPLKTNVFDARQPLDLDQKLSCNSLAKKDGAG